MSVTLSYGNYSHAADEASVSFTKEILRADSGQVWGVRETWAITGLLQGTNTADVITKQLALEAAYRRDGGNLSLADGSGNVLKSVPGRTNIGCTKVIAGPSFSDPMPGQWSTYLHYSVTVAGEFGVKPNGEPGDASLPSNLTSYQESLSLSGGGPRFVLLQPLNGLPQRQLVATSTPYLAQQSGSATGLLFYPVPPAPLFPQHEHRDRRRIERQAPQRNDSGSGRVQITWPISWSYDFESPVPLTGNPTPWR